MDLRLKLYWTGWFLVTKFRLIFKNVGIMVPWLNHENACDLNAVFYYPVENIGKIRENPFLHIL